MGGGMWCTGCEVGLWGRDGLWGGLWGVGSPGVAAHWVVGSAEPHTLSLCPQYSLAP